MEYKIGQPVKWVGENDGGYAQEFGPRAGAPVERGIVVGVSVNLIMVWWEYCDRPLNTYRHEIEPCVGPSDRSEEN